MSKKKLGWIVTILLLPFILVILFGLLIIISEGPSLYFTFPLNDTKGRYIVNYDGDYWLTYYDVKKNCQVIQDKRQCTDELIKKGNTSIAETNVDLKPFIDKTVIVKGDFIKIIRPLYAKEKELCLNKNSSKICTKSTGPGVWYSSPLKITSIELGQAQ